MLLCITSRRTSEMHSVWSESEEKRLVARHDSIKMYLRHWIFRTMTGCREHDREPSDYIKYWNVLSLSKRVKFPGGFGCFMCWILKATDTHTEYVILIAFILLQW
jgi:hypothetical protein